MRKYPGKYQGNELTYNSYHEIKLGLLRTEII